MIDVLTSWQMVAGSLSLILSAAIITRSWYWTGAIVTLILALLGWEAVALLDGGMTLSNMLGELTATHPQRVLYALTCAWAGFTGLLLHLVGEAVKNWRKKT